MNQRIITKIEGNKRSCGKVNSQNNKLNIYEKGNKNERNEQ